MPVLLNVSICNIKQILKIDLTSKILVIEKIIKVYEHL